MPTVLPTRALLPTLVLALLTCAVPRHASAHGDAKGIVLERHTLMMDLRDANRSIRAMVQGKRKLDRDALAENAQSMAELANRMAGLFPDTKASRQGAGSNTRQSAWREFARFESLADELQLRAGELAEVADSGSKKQLATRLRDVGETCKQCHKSYRRKKKH